MKAHAKFQEASSNGNTQKSRRTIHNVNISKFRNWKNGENTGTFWKIKKKLVHGNVIRNAHAKFQEDSSMGNMQKSRGTAGEMSSV